MEPRCDNEDLRMISDAADEDQNHEFGNKAIGGELKFQTNLGHDDNNYQQAVEINQNVGKIELKLPPFADRNNSRSSENLQSIQKKERLFSAKVRNVTKKMTKEQDNS